MSDIFTPQLFQNLQPAAVAPQAAPLDMAALSTPAQVAPQVVPQVAPQAPAVAPKPVFIPVPIVPKPAPKPKGLQISAEAVRKAQGIYPQEAAEKQSMIDNAKAPPTPTGAWGAPE